MGKEVSESTPLLAQIAPQRSTQYANLAATLAPAELALLPQPLARSAPTPRTLGGQEYLQTALAGPLDAAICAELGRLAYTGPWFELAERLGEQSGGPWLRPLETSWTPSLPTDLIHTRRYRGKTNEQFTHFLCNVARFSSRFAAMPWPELRVLDPLAGGGTTIFTALVLGASVAGVEQTAQDVKSTVAFLRQFLQDARLSHTVKEEQLRKLPTRENSSGRGQRWAFSLRTRKASTTAQRAILALGDTRQTDHLIAGFRPHLIVTDLPYGIQHQGPLEALLHGALPVWANLLPPGGALVFAWDATRFPRARMAALVGATCDLTIKNEGPYTRLAHPVDRVIKQRDVLVATRQ